MNILVISGGYAQLPIMEEIKRCGDTCIVADNRPDIIATKVANKIISAERYNPLAIKQAIGELKIDAIVSGGSDQGILTMAQLGEMLGIKTYVTSRIAALPVNKNEMLQVLQKVGCSVPHTISVDNLEDALLVLEKIGFPTVIKPNDGIGQLAVTKVVTDEEAKKAYAGAKNASKDGLVLIQKYLEGKEFGVNGFVVNGRFHLLTISERDTDNKAKTAFGVSFTKIFPALEAIPFTDAITKEITQAAAALHLNCAPIYSQIKLCNGVPVIIEIMPRLGGGEDPRLVQLATGFNMCKATLLAAKGISFSIEDCLEQSKHNAVVMKFFAGEDGKVASIEGLKESSQAPLVQQVICYTKVGNEIINKGSSADRLGVVISAGDSLEEVTVAANEAINKIKVAVTKIHNQKQTMTIPPATSLS